MHSSMAFCGSFICHLRICTRIGSEIFLPAENVFKLFNREKKYVLFTTWLTSVVVTVRYFAKTFSASKENDQASSYIFVRKEKLFISTLNLWIVSLFLSFYIKLCKLKFPQFLCFNFRFYYLNFEFIPLSLCSTDFQISALGKVNKQTSMTHPKKNKQLLLPIWISHSLTERSLQWSKGDGSFIWNSLPRDSLWTRFGKFTVIWSHLYPFMSSREEEMASSNIFCMLVAELLYYQKSSTLAATVFQ